jgi:hypothetical protein
MAMTDDSKFTFNINATFPRKLSTSIGEIYLYIEALMQNILRN